jgi:hypothetical protein
MIVDAHVRVETSEKKGSVLETGYTHRLFRSDICFFLLSDLGRKIISVSMSELKRKDASSLQGVLYLWD